MSRYIRHAMARCSAKLQACDVAFVIVVRPTNSERVMVLSNIIPEDAQLLLQGAAEQVVTAHHSQNKEHN